MLMIRSIVRPTKVDDVLAALMEAGFPAVTKIRWSAAASSAASRSAKSPMTRSPRNCSLPWCRSRQGFRHQDRDQGGSHRRQRRLRRRQDLCEPGGGSLHHQLGHQGDGFRRNRRGEDMKEVMAIIRMNMMNKTKKALSDAGISSMTAKDVLGRGKGLVDYQSLARRRKRLRGSHSAARAEPASDSQAAADSGCAGRARYQRR